MCLYVYIFPYDYNRGNAICIPEQQVSSFTFKKTPFKRQEMML